MAASVNKHIIVGHLGRDPEQRATQSGGKVVTFSVATSESWTDKATGEKREATAWHQVVIFNDGLGDIAMKYLKRGARVYLEGEVQTRSWEKDGEKQYRTETVLKQYRGELVLLDRADRAPPPDQQSYGTRPASPPAGGLDDEVPF